LRGLEIPAEKEKFTGLNLQLVELEPVERTNMKGKTGDKVGSNNFISGRSDCEIYNLCKTRGRGGF